MAYIVKQSNDGRWITMNGGHVMVNGDGEITNSGGGYASLLSAAKTPEDFYPKIIEPIRTAQEVKAGEYVKFATPDNKRLSAYTNGSWYGKTSLEQFNDSEVRGEVLKLNQKSVTIKTDTGEVYRVSKDAKATIDLSEWKGKNKKELID